MNKDTKGQRSKGTLACVRACVRVCVCVCEREREREREREMEGERERRTVLNHVLVLPLSTIFCRVRRSLTCVCRYHL